ncbi:MAG: macro domain-containing protein [Sulfuricaulis sp.]
MLRLPGTLPRATNNTVDPVWRYGKHGEPDLLAGCYHNSLWLATDKGLASIVFSGISTGAYRYPKAAADRRA